VLHFQKLDVYKAAISFLALTIEVTRRLPKGHSDLADQLRRSAQSTAQNIAEGAGRTSRADKAKHFTIARGEAMESACSIDVLKLEGLIDEDRHSQAVELLERVVKMLTKMIMR
jgi:four helix bundle protein